MPAFVPVILVIVVSSLNEIKPFGPVQLHDVTSVPPPVNTKVFPVHIGFGEADAVIPDGVGFTVT